MWGIKPEYLIGGAALFIVAGLVIGAVLLRDVSALATDVFLNLAAETLGIFLTVVIIGWLFKRWEESRWSPTMQDLYFPLFYTAEFLVTALTPPQSSQSNVFMYYFGESRAVPSRLRDFRAELDSMSYESFIEPASYIIRERPQYLSDTRRRLTALLGQSAPVLHRNPDLMRLVTRLNYSLESAITELDEQLRSAASDDANDVVARRVAVEFGWVAESAYDLWEWLAEQATAPPPGRYRYGARSRRGKRTTKTSTGGQ